MPITAITGKPRNGKTLKMMHMLTEEAKRATRPIFACGIDGLTPGMATVLDDPTKWNALDLTREGTCTCSERKQLRNPVTDEIETVWIPRPPHAHIVPDGAIIFVDEAWKWFGHLTNARGQQTPPHVLDMAEHGHRALDFVFTTQGPGQLYPFLRPLMADHLHCVRVMGMQACNIYEWPELQDDPKSSGARALAQKTLWLYPKTLYGKYKSASGHENIKRKIPVRVIAIPLTLALGAGALYAAYASLKPDAVVESINGEKASAATAAPPAPVSGETAATVSHSTATAYADALLPLVPSMPWSAKAYAGREVVAKPEVYCMSSQAGPGGDGGHLPASVVCITEQGTRYEMDPAEARKLAVEGPKYNPYREPPQVGQAPAGAGRGPAETGAAAAVGVGEAGQLQAGYGQFRDGS